MKCAPFDVRAASVDEQIKTPVGADGDGDGDGKILAGGQTLITTRQWFGVTEIHGRYSAGWRSTMDRPCRHGSDDHARRPVEASRSTPPEAIQGDPRPTTVSTSTEPSALAAACLGLVRAVAKVTSSIGRLDSAGISNQDQIANAKTEGKIESARLELNAAETTVNESGTGIGVEVRVPYQGGWHSLGYGRETKLGQHRPLLQYSRDVVPLTCTFPKTRQPPRSASGAGTLPSHFKSMSTRTTKWFSGTTMGWTPWQRRPSKYQERSWTRCAHLATRSKRPGSSRGKAG